jgi:integrase
MATTGVRSGEVRALQWRHILPGGWLHVQQAVKIGGLIGTTKTGEERVIAIPSRTVAMLDLWKERTLYKEPDDFIFPGRDEGRPTNVETLTHFFPGALERAKIPVEGRNLVVHSLRHTYNTIMRAVLPEEILRQFTGHKTPEMTGLYDHPTVEDTVKRLEGTRALVDCAFIGQEERQKTNRG